MRTGVVVPGMLPQEKQEAYAADIVYGTNNEYGFDYLRDNMAFMAAERAQGLSLTGKRAFHEGLDFAGRANSEVVAAAAGVVVWSGSRWGFGYAVEVNHGNGYSTLYAHNKKNLVKVGETVKKGQVLALLGSTGRSSGPHVHFEVRRNGQAVNPMKFVRATR